jgi:hypothetical protein
MNSSSGFPNIHPIGALAIFIVLPAVLMIPLRTKLHSKRKPTWNVSNRLMKKVFDIAHVMIKMAPLVALGNLLFLTLLTLNQASYMRSSLQWKKNPQYYSTINLGDFDEMNAINYVQVQYSYNAKRWSDSTGVLPDRRRLQSQVGSTMTLAYHTAEWSNMLNDTMLSRVCSLERELQAINCLAGVQYTTIVDTFVNLTDCRPYSNFTSIIYQAANTDNRRFVADNVTEGNLRSAVLFSYFDQTFCSYVDANGMYNDLNDKAKAYNLEISCTNQDINEKEFSNATHDSVYYLIAAGFVTFVCLVISCRGLWVPIITMACILAAMINATAMLPLMGYQGFSVYNGAGALIVLIYCGSSVMTFSSAWRKIVKLNTRPTPKDIIGAYQTSGQIILYVTLVSQFCFYSLTASPVLFMKQFGAFTGLSIVSFYLFFHYVVMTNWVLASKILIPKKIYQSVRDWKHDHCQCCKAIDKWCVSDGWAAAIVANHKKHEDKEYHDDEDDEDETGEYHDRKNRNEYEDEGTVVADVQVLNSNSPADSFRLGDDGSTAMSRNRQHRVNPETGSAYSSALPIEAAPFDGDGKNDEESEVDDDGNSKKNSEYGDEEDEEGGGRGIWGWCKGKRPIKVIGAIMLTVSVVALIVAYVVTLPVMSLDMGLPPQISSASNLGQQYKILEFFKSDLFQTKFPSNYPLKYSAAPTRAPTRLPTRAPTRRPTRFPTMQPTSAVTGTTEMPTMNAAVDYVDYTVYTCWGVKAKKSYRDGIPIGEIDHTAFVRYARAGTNGLISDLQDWCTYVANNRQELSISPEWSTGDCIYSQYVANTNYLRPAFQTPSNQWNEVAVTSYTAGSLIGIATNSTSDIPNPVYVCGNFSVRSYVDSIEGHQQEITKVRDTWESAFQLEGIVRAKGFGIATLSTSPAFTYPILDSIVQEMSLTRIIAIPIVFYAFLLWILTLADVGLTLFGALGMFVILSITVCLHAYFVSPDIDLFDVMLICGVLTVVVDFPVHSIGEYMSARAYVDRQQLLIESSNDHDAEERRVVPAISMTSKHIRHAIVTPTMLVVFAGIPLLGAELNIYRKVGQYVIVVGVLSFVFTYFFQPYLLAFGCRTRIYETLCVEVEEEEVDDEVEQEGSGSEGSGSQGEEETQSEYTRSNYTTPSQAMSMPMQHPGNVSMYQTIPPPPPQGYIMPTMMMPDNDARSEYSRSSAGSQPNMISMYGPNHAASMMLGPRGGPRPMYHGTLGADPAQMQMHIPGAPGYPSMHNMYERHPSGFAQMPPMGPNNGAPVPQQSMYRPGSVMMAPQQPPNMGMYGQPMQPMQSMQPMGASPYNMNPNSAMYYPNASQPTMSMYGMQPPPRPY